MSNMPNIEITPDNRFVCDVKISVSFDPSDMSDKYENLKAAIAMLPQDEEETTEKEEL